MSPENLLSLSELPACASSENLHAGLKLLREAHHYAVDLGRMRWQFRSSVERFQGLSLWEFSE
jgi:hypothetical protein